jgi:glucokinase
VGGTGCRFGWIAGEDGIVADVAAIDDSASLEAAVERYLERHAPGRPAAAALAVAAPMLGDTVTMTNRAWTFSIGALARRLALDRLLVLNDFAALAHGLTTLAEGDCRPVGGGRAIEGAPMGLLGPGTGLGVSALLPAPSGAQVVAGEGGHVSLASATPREDEVVRLLRGRFGHVSAERVLSGDGIVNLHDALRLLDGHPAHPRSAAQITSLALDAADPACVEAVALFFAFLGSVAGDLALTLGARGGVFIAGGIVARLGEAIRASAFRDRFEAKGRYRSYLAAIPTAVILEPATAALRGANAALGR